MDNLCKYHKFVYGKLKIVCPKEHVKEACKEGSHCKVIKICSLRHQKMCIRIVMEGLCHFGEKCAYKHKEISPFHYGSKENVHEDMKTLEE